MTKPTSARGKKASPISIRLTLEERQALETATGKASLSQYIRSKLFNSINSEQSPLNEVRRISPQVRQELLARLLGELGKSTIAQSLSELAYAAKIGVLPVTPDVLAEIGKACSHIDEIRSTLLRALGLRLGGDHDPER